MKPEIKFIQVNQVPTKILVYDDDGGGGGNEFDCHTKFNKQRLIMMITGNPGEIEYYTDFLSTLYSELKIPLIGVSHAGHSRMPGCYSRPSINSELFGLQAQISHKAQFIRNHIDSSTKIILIGHSIGCYIILELLDRYPDIARMVDHCILLYPTIDSIADTESGRWNEKLIKYLIYPMLALAYLFNFLLNDRTREQLFGAYLRYGGYDGLSESFIRSATNLLDPYCIRAITLMASEEFDQVLQPKLLIIEANATKLSMFYGESDPWVPLHSYHKIKDKIPPDSQLDIQLCLGQMLHAFMMQPDSIGKISQLTSNVIRNKWKL